MNDLTFNRDSWHYKLVYVWGQSNPNQPVTLCQYTQQVLWEVLMIVAMVTATLIFIALGIIALVDVVLSIWFTIRYGIEMLSDSVLVVGIILGGYLMHIMITQYEHRRSNKVTRMNVQYDSLTKSIYTRWRNPFCTLVEFR